MSTLKLIFLDIDGVICCNMVGRLEENKLAVLSHIVRKTGAKVVLSTDWRRQPQLKKQLVTTLQRIDVEVTRLTASKLPPPPHSPWRFFPWRARIWA